MYAVIKTGGKQYRVAEGDEIVVEKLDAAAGKDVTFDDVLLIGGDAGVTVGAPTIAGASVVGKVSEQRKGKKVMIVKKRQRSTYRRRNGHRQFETVVTIESILADGKAAPKKKAAAPKADDTKAEAAKPDAKAAKAAAKPAEKAADKKPAAKKAAEKKPADAKAAGGADDRGRLSAPQGKADDLKLITGVGPAFEKKLNGAGIYHFWQIAGLTKAQVADLEEELSMAGRMERDEWVKQAKALAKDA